MIRSFYRPQLPGIRLIDQDSGEHLDVPADQVGPLIDDLIAEMETAGLAQQLAHAQRHGAPSPGDPGPLIPPPVTAALRKDPA